MASDRKAEELVQSLLKARLGLGVEAWGGSRDWGRDAYFKGVLHWPSNEQHEGIFVFQCKFVVSANAPGSNPLLSSLRSERDKVQVYLESDKRWAEPPTCYTLFTNATLSPELRNEAESLLKSVLPECGIRSSPALMYAG